MNFDMKINRNKTIYLNNRRKTSHKSRQGKTFWGPIVGVSVMIGSVLAFWPNAYEVKIDGVVVGAIEEKAYLENAEDTVVAQLKNKYNTEVQLEGDITQPKRVRARKKELITPNYLATYMRENMDFQLEFQELSIDGKKIGIIESEDTLDELLERLTKEYIGQTDSKVEFSNKVELTPVFAKEKDLMSLDTLTDKALQKTKEIVEYEVGAGDTLWGIANKLGISVAKLIDSNEGMTDKSVLSIGMKLKAEVNVPLLGVQIVE